MTVLTGSAIDDYRMRVLLSGLKLETKGMQISRGRSCYSIIKQEFGLKGNKQRVLEQFTAIVSEKLNANVS